MISKTLMAASTKPIILSILSAGEDYSYSIIRKVKNATDKDKNLLFPSELNSPSRY